MMDQPVPGDHPIDQRELPRGLDERLRWSRDWKFLIERPQRRPPTAMHHHSVQLPLVAVNRREGQSGIATDIEAAYAERRHAGHDGVRRQDQERSPDPDRQGQLEVRTDVHLAVQSEEPASLEHTQ